SIALLGGTREEPMNLHPKDRLAIDNYIDSGKKVFSEYVTSISELYFTPPASTQNDRLVFCLDSDSDSEIQKGEILDDQYNMRIHAYYEHEGAESILQYS